MMEVMERDPQYIAGAVKRMRKWFRLTQENLADAANLTTRTIEKVESGRHTPNEQTLRCIARAFNVDVQIFDKPTPERERRERVEMMRAIRKTAIVPTQPVHEARDFLRHFAQRHCFRFDMSAVKSQDAMQRAAAMIDWVKDVNDSWDELRASERLECAREFMDMAREVEKLGYLTHLGSHRQRLRKNSKPDLVFDVGLLVFLSKERDKVGCYAIVKLEGSWETLEENWGPVPEEWRKAIAG